MSTLKSNILKKQKAIASAVKSAVLAKPSIVSLREAWNKGWNKDGH